MEYCRQGPSTITSQDLPNLYFYKQPDREMTKIPIMHGSQPHYVRRKGETGYEQRKGETGLKIRGDSDRRPLPERQPTQSDLVAKGSFLVVTSFWWATLAVTGRPDFPDHHLELRPQKDIHKFFEGIPAHGWFIYVDSEDAAGDQWVRSGRERVGSEVFFMMPLATRSLASAYPIARGR